MAWVKLDDQAPRHAKMLKAGPAACWLWVCGIAHCQSQLTDGYVSLDALPMIGIKGTARCRRLADELVDAGLFDKAEDGYMVHGYLDHNPSRAVVLRKRAEDAYRKREGEESTRNPNGIRTESGAPRAGVPSHPIRSHPIPAPTEPIARGAAFRTDGVTAGMNPKDHLKHSACDETFSRCVPTAVHAKLCDLLAPKHGGDRQAAGLALKDWYPTVWATLPADFVMGEAFRFWQGRFDATFASADASSNRKPLFTTTVEEDARAVLALVNQRGGVPR